MFGDLVPRLLRSRLGLPGLILAILVILFALLGPLLSPYPPNELHPDFRLSPPSRVFVMGTDNYGRDLFARVAHGARISLRVGLISVVVSASAGTAVGLLAGYFGGMLDSVLMHIMEVLLAFPSLLLALAFMAALGSTLNNLIIAISVVYIPVFARLIRGEVLSLRERTFVDGARAIGATPGHIVRYYMFPNVLPLLIIQATIQLSEAILAESSLSYLGFGTQPPAASWGRMLSEGRAFLEIAPWMAIWPGLLLMMTLVGFSLLGDGLRDALDPWLVKR